MEFRRVLFRSLFPGYCILKWLRGALIWTGPLAILLLAVVCGFGYWVLGTPAGTRWALITVAEQFDGQASGISGSIWDGVDVGRFSQIGRASCRERVCLYVSILVVAVSLK